MEPGKGCRLLPREKKGKRCELSVAVHVQAYVHYVTPLAPPEFNTRCTHVGVVGPFVDDVCMFAGQPLRAYSRSDRYTVCCGQIGANIPTRF